MWQIKKRGEFAYIILKVNSCKYIAIINKIDITFDHLRFEVFTVVTTKNGVFWDVTPCGSCKNRCFDCELQLTFLVHRLLSP
jgi:hypothetical protein